MGEKHERFEVRLPASRRQELAELAAEREAEDEEQRT